jgi:hypothetical protein
VTGKPYRTKSGRRLTDAEIETLADEVARPSYEPPGVAKRGRPLLGDGPSELVPVRLDPALRAALDARATNDETTVSEVIRTALRRHLDAA